MPSTGTRLKFIEDIAKYVIKYAPQYDIKVNSPVISQAIVESKYGESGLAKYHNYFGLKCGKSWKGKSVNMKTKEEYTVGTLTDISANFRAYDSMEEGVKGYFDFINKPRYANLKNVTDPLTYVTNIKNDGYATSSTYINTIMTYIKNENLTRFDGVTQSQTQTVPEIIIQPNTSTVKYSADVIIDIAKSYLGYSESNGKHRQIVDLYNTQNPLPAGYKVKYTDAWCATFVSACAIKANYTAIIPTECSCERMIEKFKKAGIWQEDESVIPKKGWIIFYDWQDNGVGNNTGHSDHVGYVISVDNGIIQVIEGNYHDEVGIRSIAVNGRYIRGYGIPKYTEVPSTQTVVTHVQEKPKTSGTTTSSQLSKEVKFKAKVTANKLNVRSWAGSNYSLLSFSPLVKGTTVGVCDVVKAADGSEWYYIEYLRKHGFCSAKYFERVSDSITVDTSNNEIILTPNEHKNEEVLYQVKVNTKLNMRSTPNSNANNILYKLSNGTRLIGTGDNPSVGGTDWIGVIYNGTKGYCSAKYLVKL